MTDEDVKIPTGEVFKASRAAKGEYWSTDLLNAPEETEVMLAVERGQAISRVLAQLTWSKPARDGTRRMVWHSTLTGEEIDWAEPYAFHLPQDPPDLGSIGDDR